MFGNKHFVYIKCSENRKIRTMAAGIKCILSVPASQTVRDGDRRFAVAVLNLYKRLPDSANAAKTLPQYKKM